MPCDCISGCQTVAISAFECGTKIDLLKSSHIILMVSIGGQLHDECLEKCVDKTTSTADCGYSAGVAEYMVQFVSSTKKWSLNKMSHSDLSPFSFIHEAHDKKRRVWCAFERNAAIRFGRMRSGPMMQN